MKSDEELLVEAVANSESIYTCCCVAFASIVVVVVVELNSHEEKVCKIRDNFVYMEIISYMLDSALGGFPLKHYILYLLLLKILMIVLPI